MAYGVELAAAANRELGKLDAQQSKRVLKFLYERVAKAGDPHSIGKALLGGGTTLSVAPDTALRGVRPSEFASKTRNVRSRNSLKMRVGVSY
jgi:hypothetical protein